LQFIDGSKRLTNMCCSTGDVTAENRLLDNAYWELDENTSTWDETFGFMEDRDEVHSPSNGHLGTDIGVFSPSPRNRRKYWEIEGASPKKID
jgi:hypothetical protein